jgi:hypothetical protein
MQARRCVIQSWWWWWWGSEGREQRGIHSLLCTLAKPPGSFQGPFRPEKCPTVCYWPIELNRKQIQKMCPGLGCLDRRLACAGVPCCDRGLFANLEPGSESESSRKEKKNRDVRHTIALCIGAHHFCWVKLFMWLWWPNTNQYTNVGGLGTNRVRWMHMATTDRKLQHSFTPPNRKITTIP